MAKIGIIRCQETALKPDNHRCPGWNCFPAIAIVRIPHISNFTDFDPLMNIDSLNVYFVEKPQDLTAYSSVILPGSKNTRYDLNWLHETGWSKRLKAYARGGGHVMGICGGYQMLGTRITDPDHTESTLDKVEGLGLLPALGGQGKAPRLVPVNVLDVGLAFAVAGKIDAHALLPRFWLVCVACFRLVAAISKSRFL